MSRPRETLRKAFKRQLRVKLYHSLRKLPLIEGWGVEEIFALSDSIMKEKDDRIDDYLNTHEVTLKQAEEAMEAILKEILLPGIEKRRI